jgi:hypothetical protein
MMIVGAWFLTVPDPSGLGEDRYGTARKIIRIALVVGLLNQLINWVLQASPPLAPAAQLAFQTIALVAGIVGVVGQFAQLYYLHKLALRIPNPDLSQRARFLMWALGISYGLLLVAGFAAVAVFASRAGAAAPAAAGAGCFAAILGIAVLVFSIMYLFMLGRFGREFKAQAGPRPPGLVRRRGTASCGLMVGEAGHAGRHHSRLTPFPANSYAAGYERHPHRLDRRVGVGGAAARAGRGHAARG